jgi:hypothetical protein
MWQAGARRLRFLRNNDLPDHLRSVCAIHNKIARAGANGANRNCDLPLPDFYSGIKIVILARQRPRPRISPRINYREPKFIRRGFLQLYVVAKGSVGGTLSPCPREA